LRCGSFRVWVRKNPWSWSRRTPLELVTTLGEFPAEFLVQVVPSRMVQENTQQRPSEPYGAVESAAVCGGADYGSPQDGPSRGASMQSSQAVFKRPRDGPRKGPRDGPLDGPRNGPLASLSRAGLVLGPLFAACCFRTTLRGSLSTFFFHGLFGGPSRPGPFRKRLFSMRLFPPLMRWKQGLSASFCLLRHRTCTRRRNAGGSRSFSDSSSPTRLRG